MSVLTTFDSRASIQAFPWYVSGVANRVITTDEIDNVALYTVTSGSPDPVLTLVGSSVSPPEPTWPDHSIYDTITSDAAVQDDPPSTITFFELTGAVVIDADQALILLDYCRLGDHWNADNWNGDAAYTSDHYFSDVIQCAYVLSSDGTLSDGVEVGRQVTYKIVRSLDGADPPELDETTNGVENDNWCSTFGLVDGTESNLIRMVGVEVDDLIDIATGTPVLSAASLSGYTTNLAHALGTAHVWFYNGFSIVAVDQDGARSTTELAGVLSLGCLSPEVVAYTVLAAGAWSVAVLGGATTWLVPTCDAAKELHVADSPSDAAGQVVLRSVQTVWWPEDGHVVPVGVAWSEDGHTDPGYTTYGHYYLTTTTELAVLDVATGAMTEDFTLLQAATVDFYQSGSS